MAGVRQGRRRIAVPDWRSAPCPVLGVPLAVGAGEAQTLVADVAGHGGEASHAPTTTLLFAIGDRGVGGGLILRRGDAARSQDDSSKNRKAKECAV